MPREHPIVTNIKERIERKKSDLATLREQRAVMDVAIAGIEAGIRDDEALLADAKTKTPRMRKAKGTSDQSAAASIAKGK